MTPELWERVKQVFRDALLLAPAERSAFLDQACVDDAPLRDEVEALLESHEEAGSFLETPAVAVASAKAAPLRAGTRLGPYEITALLGAGGMGEVYRARDERLGREVAVKVLPADFASSPERLSRFEQEARAASALNHPHILAVYDVGRHDGLPYLVTELLEGQTLAERIAQGPVPLRRALEWAAQAARGLTAAHERGIVHRDVKPANLFVTEDGQLKIVDFGLAKVSPEPQRARAASGSPTSPLTSPGVPLGTVGYMSPEQVRGEALDLRSDQFSLGCVVYELLAGSPPFARPTAAESLAAVLGEEPPSVLERNARVPPHVAWTVERCLAKDPADRYAATRDLARDLELALGRLSGLSGPVPRRPLPARRLALAAAAGLALLALGVAAWRLWPETPAPVPIVRYLTFSGRDGSPAASADGRTIAFSSSRDGRRRLWMLQVATGMEVPLTDGEDDHPRFSPDGSVVLFARSQEGRTSLFRVPSVGGEARKLVDDALYGDFSPDGRRVAFVRQLRDDAASPGTTVLGLAGADGSSVRELARFKGGPFVGSAFVQPRWSPDGRTLAATQSKLQLGEPTVIALVDAESGNVRTLRLPGQSGVWLGGLAWVGSEDILCAQPESVVGQQMGTSSRLALLHVPSGRTRVLLSSPVNLLKLDVLGPGQVVLGARSLRQNLREIPLRPSASAAERWLTHGSSDDRQPAYGPDGEWIAFSSNRSGNLDIWAVSRRTAAVRRLTDDVAHDSDPGFMPDGRLLWSSNRSGRFEIWLAEADGSGARQLSRDGVDAENPVVTPDGEWIVYASANPRSHGIMKVRSDGSAATLLVPGNLIEPEVSPDGRHLAFVADAGSERAALRVVSMSDGKQVLEVPLPSWRPGSNIDLGRCRWLPGGRALAYIGQELDGRYGVFVRELARGADKGRRLLVRLDPDQDAESLGVSPDGAYVTVSFREQRFDLMLADNVPGIDRPRR